MSRFVRFAGHRTADAVLRAQKVDESIRAVHDSLSQTQQLSLLQQVATTYGLSAPLIAAMSVSPVLANLMTKVGSFNVVPEHRSSPRQQLGLEVLEVAVATSECSAKTASSDVVSAIATTLNSLEATAVDFKGQLAYAHSLLVESEITDEVIENLNVTTLSADGFAHLFAVLENSLGHVVPFDVSHLQANPEKIEQEVSDLSSLLGEIGPVLGLGITSHGISNAPKASEYDCRTSTFGQLGLDKSTLVYYLGRAEALCDQLIGLSQVKSELVSSLTAAVENMPTESESNDVVYGRADHLSLFSCYSKLVSGLVQESILAVARLLTASEVVLESEAGSFEAADEPIVG